MQAKRMAGQYRAMGGIGFSSNYFDEGVTGYETVSE